MADRVDGRPAAPTESTIRDWDDADPSGQTYRRVLFVDSDLTEVENRGGVFEECTFRGVRFNASVHLEAAFMHIRELLPAARQASDDELAQAILAI